MTRICLNLRLDWDSNTSRASSDMYRKPRLVMLASTVVFGLFYGSMVVRVRRVAPSLHGIGRYRRNVLTFHELTGILTGILLFFLVESMLVFVLYRAQDLLGTRGVFLIYTGYSVTMEGTLTIGVVWATALRSRTNFPELWLEAATTSQAFFITPSSMEPRGEASADRGGGEVASAARGGGEVNRDSDIGKVERHDDEKFASVTRRGEGGVVRRGLGDPPAGGLPAPICPVA